MNKESRLERAFVERFGDAATRSVNLTFLVSAVVVVGVLCIALRALFAVL